MSLLRRAAVVIVFGVAAAACSSGSAPRAVESNEASGTATSAAPTTETTDAPDPTDDGTDTTDSTEPTDDGSLDWSSCPEDDTPSIGEVECATLTVPLDYDEPDGTSIDLSLMRVAAVDDREGAVLTNPGGPGGSGVDFLVNAGPTIQAEMGLGSFDIVGFDPRGVDRSNGIRCISDDVQDKYLYVDPTPDDASEEQLLNESRDAFANGCRETYGDDLIHYSTENTARDMDEIRKALGDEQISYLGISYGTYLGAVYATMFPDQVRAMVLDAAFEPTGDTVEQQWITQLVGFEGAFDNWSEWCAGDESCPFHADTADAVGARWDALYDTLDLTSLEVDGRSVNPATLMTATIESMYSEAIWPDLAGALADAEQGDVAGILRIADSYNQRRPDGTFSTIHQANPVISCASGIRESPPDDPQALLDQMRVEAPRFSRTSTLADFRDKCTPLIGTTVTPPELQYEGDGPILVVGGTNDPATPFRWAEEMTEKLGDSAALLTYTGEGHGALLGSDCVSEAQGDALSDLELPDEPTTCDPDPPIEKPEWWDDLPVPEGVGEVEEIPALAAALGLTPSIAYSEMRLTDLSADEVREAYKTALEDDDFTYLVEQEALPDVMTDVYAPNELGLGFIILTLPPEAFENEDLANLADVVPAGKTVVVLGAVGI